MYNAGSTIKFREALECFGRGCLPMSPKQSIKNSCCENEYLAAENRILRGQIKGRLLLSEGEKATLAEIGHRLPRMLLEDVAATAKPDTIHQNRLLQRQKAQRRVSERQI